jgi:hypothetical protein
MIKAKDMCPIAIAKIFIYDREDISKFSKEQLEIIGQSIVNSMQNCAVATDCGMILFDACLDKGEIILRHRE